MSDPLLIALFDAAVRAARGEDLLVANSAVGPSAWRYFGPGGSIDVPLPQSGRGRVLVTGAGKAAASLARGLEAVLGAEETLYGRFLSAVEAALPASRTHGAIPLA